MSDSENMTYSAEHVQQLLRCSVCLDRFKQPKLLPCQHTFCLSPCIEGLVDRLTRILRCPECRADHIVPRGGPSHFPNNLTIISFLELPPLNGERPNVEAVVESRAAAQNVSSTRSSYRSQAAGRPTNRGPGLGIGGRDAGEGGGGGGGCAACRTEGRLARCSHCDQLLCESCKRAHMDMVRTDVNRLVSQVRRVLPQVTEQINTVGRKGAQLQNRCESLKSEVAEIIEKHIRDLKTRERLLAEDIDSFVLGELRGLRTHQENLEVELASMASFCDSAESTLSRTRHLTDGDLVELKRQCVENMATLRDYENGTLRPPVPRNIQLSAESQFLTSTISNFGDLIITSGSSALQASDMAGTRTSNMLGVPQRRTTMRAPETATDYALSVLSSRSSSLSPGIARRGGELQPRNARSAQVNFADEDLYEEDEEDSPPRSHPLRRAHRQTSSDSRIAGLMGGGGGSDNSNAISRQRRQNRIRRHRSLGALPSSNENSDQTESSPEREIPDRRRTRMFTLPDSDEESVGIGMAPSLTYPPRRPVRTPIRFDVSLNSPEPEEDEEGPRRSRGGAQVHVRADNSPSMYVTTPRNKYNQKGQAMIRFGERGNGERQFTWPRGVAVSPLDDFIFVSDSSNHRVQVFDNTGVYIRSFGCYGQGDGEFDCLAGITVNGLGQIIISDRYNHRIQIFDRGGNFQRAFGSEGTDDGQLNYPWGVACDNMGFIYVCDKENHRIQVFQSNGTFVRKFGRLGNGNAAGHFDNPHYVAVSSDNKVYVSDSSNHRIQVFSIYGDFLFSFGISGTLRGQMKFPRGIAIDNQGFVVVADSGNNRVQIFRADGRYYSMFGAWGSENGQFKGIEGLAILSNGNVVVSDRENHRIQIF
ncbi:RING finger protein nhl-1-like [Littorina saxatilis]|uniref:RING-type domain-containing protein n=1 Tax=Littorina saxatilis TaxID=31220 RepID=A0AAN9BPQ7_9CAEN